MSVKWIPNALTGLRILAAPFVAFLVYAMFATDDVILKEFYASAAFTLFVLAAATDWLDGYFARKLDASSALGAKLDLWADKIIVFAVLVACLPFMPVLAIIGLFSLSIRDIVIMRLRAMRPDVNLKATFLAKSKTAVIMTGMAMAMAGYAFALLAIRLGDPDGAAIMHIVTRLGLSLYAFGCVLSLGTGYQYLQAAFTSASDSSFD